MDRTDHAPFWFDKVPYISSIFVIETLVAEHGLFCPFHCNKEEILRRVKIRSRREWGKLNSGNELEDLLFWLSELPSQYLSDQCFWKVLPEFYRDSMALSVLFHNEEHEMEGDRSWVNIHARSTTCGETDGSNRTLEVYMIQIVPQPYLYSGG